MSATSEWLQSLKAGDEVAVITRMATAQIKKVSRVTATQIIVHGNSRYRKSDGNAVALQQYSIDEITPVTGEIREKWERAKIINLLSRHIAGLTIDQLRRIASIVAETAKGEVSE